MKLYSYHDLTASPTLLFRVEAESILEADKIFTEAAAELGLKAKAVLGYACSIGLRLIAVDLDSIKTVWLQSGYWHDALDFTYSEPTIYLSKLFDTKAELLEYVKQNRIRGDLFIEYPSMKLHNQRERIWAR